MTTSFNDLNDTIGYDSESDLVVRLRMKEDEAYERLFRTHVGTMIAVARKIFGDSDDAADAVQDAFVSAFRSIDRFGGTSKLATWLHRITVNTCLMKIRSRKRSRLVSLEGMEMARTGFADEDHLSREETKWRVRECINQLPESFRIVIQLRDLEELDTATTAACLGTTEAVVKTRLHRARHSLRRILTEHGKFVCEN